MPFSIEAGGVWGPAARRFFKECIALANDDRDIDLYLQVQCSLARHPLSIGGSWARPSWRRGGHEDMRHVDQDGHVATPLGLTKQCHNGAPQVTY